MIGTATMAFLPPGPAIRARFSCGSRDSGAEAALSLREGGEDVTSHRPRGFTQFVYACADLWLWLVRVVMQHFRRYGWHVDSAEAEDIAGKVILKLLQRWRNYDPERASLETLMWKIARDEVVTIVRDPRLDPGPSPEPPRKNVDVSWYDENLTEALKRGGPPHQIIVYFLRPSGWEPAAIVEALSDESLDDLTTRLEQDHIAVFPEREQFIRRCFKPLRDSLNAQAALGGNTYGDHVQDASSKKGPIRLGGSEKAGDRSAAASAPGRNPSSVGRSVRYGTAARVGESRLRDYYESPGGPIKDVYNWISAVRKRLISALVHKGQNDAYPYR